MADRFFTDKPLSLGEFVLDGPEAHHLGTVRRFAPGDAVVLFNGDGSEYPAEIVEVGKRHAVLRLLARVEANREVPFPIVVGSALPKGDRLDFLLEKLVEVGATRFVPLITERSVVRPNAGKLEKWRRAVIEASKQCGRNRLMTVHEPLSMEEFVNREYAAKQWLLHTSSGPPHLDPLADPEYGCAFAVGPEGGFNDAEIEMATLAGWRRLSLGPRVMRVETAAIAAALWAANGQ